MGMASEFREFIAKGNVVDLAVGVVIGAAFGKIVTALVDKAPSLVCRMDKLIDKTNPGKSFIVTKVRGSANTVSCPSGGMNNGGAKMPFMPQPALSNDEADCLENWAYQVSR